MGRERADLGFGVEDSFDPADWSLGTPAPTRPESGTARAAAEATGFRSRESGAGGGAAVSPAPAAAAPGPAKPRRRRTGRNAQFNLKARPDTITQFCAVADAKGWGLGGTLGQAVVLLEREYGRSDPTKSG